MVEMAFCEANVEAREAREAQLHVTHNEHVRVHVSHRRLPAKAVTS